MASEVMNEGPYGSSTMHCNVESIIFHRHIASLQDVDLLDRERENHKDC